MRSHADRSWSDASERPPVGPGARAPSGSVADKETVAGLPDRLKTLRAQRLDDEAQAAQLLTPLRAIALSLLNRDAGHLHARQVPILLG